MLNSLFGIPVFWAPLNFLFWNSCDPNYKYKEWENTVTLTKETRNRKLKELQQRTNDNLRKNVQTGKWNDPKNWNYNETWNGSWKQRFNWNPTKDIDMQFKTEIQKQRWRKFKHEIQKRNLNGISERGFKQWNSKETYTLVILLMYLPTYIYIYIYIFICVDTCMFFGLGADGERCGNKCRRREPMS